MKIVIIRHAEPDYENNTLTKKGFKEADILGKYFKDIKIDYLYSSPLNRAKFTADGIVKYKNGLKYEVLDFLEEFYSPIDLDYCKNHICWDLRASFLNDNNALFDCDKWQTVNGFNSDGLTKRYKDLKLQFASLLEKRGYVKNGNYYDVVKPNHDTLVFVCHFGTESFLLSELLGVSPILLANYTVSRPTGVTILTTEEREKGKAIFRLLEFGTVYHLEKYNEEPSFMARFVECFDDDGKNVD